MTNKEFETVDQVLEKEVKEDKKSKKGIVFTILSVVAAAGVLVSSIALFGKNKNKDATTTTTTTISEFGLDGLGDELTTNATSKTTYKVVSGNLDPNKIVEQDDKLYKDATEASKAKNKTTSIDLQGGKLTVTDGKVYNKTTGYVIKDQTGTTKTGDLDKDGIPAGYAYDSVLKKYVPKEEVGKYVYADATYYDNEGNVVLKKGDVVLKETLEKAKKYFSTTQPTTKKSTTTTTVKSNSTTSTTKKTTTTTVADQGKVNKDGTYTIFGLTFKTKADYQQWVLQGYEGYVEADGIMISQEELNNRIHKTK